MPKRINIYIKDDSLAEAIKVAADEDNRSMTRCIETWLKNIVKLREDSKKGNIEAKQITVFLSSET